MFPISASTTSTKAVAGMHRPHLNDTPRSRNATSPRPNPTHVSRRTALAAVVTSCVMAVVGIAGVSAAGGHDDPVGLKHFKER
jgi:hypothetical protein